MEKCNVVNDSTPKISVEKDPADKREKLASETDDKPVSVLHTEALARVHK